MVSPIGAEKEWVTTGSSLNPCAAIHWVPIQPDTMESPTTNPQKIVDHDVNINRFAKETIIKPTPMKSPVVKVLISNIK